VRAGINSYTLLLCTVGGAAVLGMTGFLGFGGIKRKRKTLPKQPSFIRLILFLRLLSNRAGA